MRNFLSGTVVVNSTQYAAIAIIEQRYFELRLSNLMDKTLDAYKIENYEDEWAYNSNLAKDIYEFIRQGDLKCNKNNMKLEFKPGLGSVKIHTIRNDVSSWIITKGSRGLTINIEAYGKVRDKTYNVLLASSKEIDLAEIDYIKLTNVKSIQSSQLNNISSGLKVDNSFEETVPVRSLAEISLEKDTTWLKNKKYYIVNEAKDAEEIFAFLESYKGLISYDTETTGLCINMFGEIGSKQKAEIDAKNAELLEEGKTPYKVDRLVGIIFCVQPDVSYYFPCFNRKFKNLYEDRDNPIVQQTIDKIYARYTVGDLRDSKTNMANYIRNTPKEEWACDVIMMERCRDILEKGYIGAHHGSFEYKVGLMYSIDTNLCEDSMLLHQLLYKFRNPLAGDRGEPSNLKYLTKVEFGVDQLDLKDFFVNYKEDASGYSRASKRNFSRIDFSYMDYDGARAYAPADGDFTLGLITKYRKGLDTVFKKQTYLYSVEMYVSCAIGYMEYNGHRLDERQIEATKVNTYVHMMEVEKKIRDLINANTSGEIIEFNLLQDAKKELAELSTLFMKDRKNTEISEKYDKSIENVSNHVSTLRTMYDTSENQINLASPQQVAELFYDRLGIPVGKDGKRSVDKRTIKPLAKAMNEDMTPKYPVVKLYQDWKNDSTLLTKFFDNLPYFMYPGGFIFSSYGQIATATGRMSCKGPNAQQYPHSVTCMVIPRDNCVFVDADYSQIEYRTLTALAREDSLMQKFKDPDMDYHTTMASLMYDTPYANVTGKMRSEAKTFNFGIPYGMGLRKLAFQLKGSEDDAAVAEAKEKYELYFKEQPHVRQFFDDVKEKARIYNYTETNWGRRRYYSFNDAEGNLDRRRMSSALRQAGNAVIQGCLAPDTKILTREFGIVEIKQVNSLSLSVWNGEGWVKGDIVYSGKKRKCIITFSNGQKFVCSPTHKFLIYDGDADDIEDYIECRNLKSGDKIAINKTGELRVRCDGNISFITVISVGITDEYIDMYDVCNTDGGYYVADGIITHNTAADIFKIGVARNFLFIRRNKLFGKYFITNMVHDEQLVEIDASVLNVKKILASLIEAMELHMDGFPPLYVGAGVGASWDEAKGKMAEIHPLLGLAYVAECNAEGASIYTDSPKTPEEIYAYFKDRNFKFREKKILDYVLDEQNYGKVLHPVIGSLLGLQFDYGVSKELKERFSGKEGIDYTKEEKEEAEKYSPMERLDRFIKDHNLDIPITNFQETKGESADSSQTDEEEEDYDEFDGDFEDGVLQEDFSESEQEGYQKIDEDNLEYGIKLEDIVREFNYLYSTSRKIIALNWLGLTPSSQRKLTEFLTEHIAENINTDNVFRVLLLDASGKLKPGDNEPQLYVSNIREKELAKLIEVIS